MDNVSVASVTIIICTYNRAEDLRMTLASLGQVKVPDGFECELIVVDNASTDHTRQVIEVAELKNLALRSIYERKQGQCYARNTGMAHAKGDIFLWTDDDVRLPQDWIERMCRPIIEGLYLAVAGGVKMDPSLRRPWMTDALTGGLAETSRLRAESLNEMVGANMAFSRRVLLKVPAFDTELGPGALGFGDDTLFALQLVESGVKIGSCLDVCVEHHFDPSRLQKSSFITGSRKMGRSAAYITYHWDHQAPSTWLPLLKARLKLILSKIRHRGGSPEGIIAVDYYAFFYIAYAKILSEEKKKIRNYERRGLVKLNNPSVQPKRNK